jgi:hypothetical protein
MFFSLRKTPVRRERRTKWSVIVGSVPALAGLLVLAAGTTFAQDNRHDDSIEFSGSLIGNFTTVAPAPLLTLDDSVSGSAGELGEVTGNFTVIVDFNQPVGKGLVLVTKTGSLVTADGDKINLAMVGTFNVATFDVHYVFFVTGGTGRFARATGIGTWHVPPPTTFDPATGSGSGSEIFEGTIFLPNED